MLLTSVAFLLAAVQLTRQQVLVQELPAVEGLARVDVVCLDKTGTLTVGDIAYEDCEPCADLPARSRIAETALGALADDPNANGTLKALAAALTPPQGWDRTQTIAFNSARKWSAASFTDRGSLRLRRARRAARRGRPAARPGSRERARPAGGCVLLAHTDAALDGQVLPVGMQPARPGDVDRAGPARTRRTRWTSSRRRASTSRSSPATTRRPSPPSPAGSAWTSARQPAVRRPDHRHRRRGAARDRQSRRPSSAGCQPGAEAGAGPGAAGRRPCRGDDRRRRQRRAGAQGRRHRRRHEQRCAGHQGGRPTGPARRQVLAPAVGAGRGPAGDRQRRAGGQPVRRQERDEPDRHRHGRGCSPCRSRSCRGT